MGGENSFGEDWGEDGYFHRARTATGGSRIGMYFESAYPIDEDEGSSRRCIPGAMYRTDYYRAMFGLTAQEGETNEFLSSDRETSDAPRHVVVCDGDHARRAEEDDEGSLVENGADTPLLNAQNN